jgi:hypothetical protein
MNLRHAVPGTHNTVPGTVVRLRNHIFASVDASKGPEQWLAG